MSLQQAMKKCPAVAILRSSSAARYSDVSDVLVEAGIRAVEFTFTAPDVADAIRAYAACKPADVALGAGTVITVEQARAAVEAGATYLISPSICVDVIEEGTRLGVPVLPGALTPTEILTAWRAGAAMVKVFPASAVGGPSYIKAVRGPLSDIPLVPTGGVDVDNAGAYLAAGAVGVGVGSPLVADACEPGGDLDALSARARALVASVTGAVARP
ncbi:bifunctional 4-hydroxy-2-oxoglutarate aldolase/2-dehydro-3-deoxy-phosphogluconate aldolase [Actinopolymorpha alba]|uniref:bifunctional 4-hydroxy-2-oxoglutarate aldolase/2-dehydro-3-deoxy-phosphogluconate aldolase n=1 Tax=Actinopolymorpha alba TaxID=533267 RepID=UPI000360117D|nr:bifunctional 4-hydroxy-2-oxoglutarate aldolase/2-dehydro-3-deoxy-phosphogluconate aldolase [Actinopolymorpha alba]